MQSTPDPVLDLLISAERSTCAAHDAARAALAAYRGDTAVEPTDDLVSLRDAETEFRISNDTARRWAKVKNLGEMVDGEWYLSRSLVRRHGLA